MNGSDSNTSGIDVVNIGQVPRGSLQAFIDMLSTTITQLRDLQTGDADLVSADFMEFSGSDCISDDRMGEICRRLVLTLDRGIQGNVIFSAAEPLDHTKAWQQIDPVTGIPVGQYKIWNNTSSQWVSPVAPEVYTPPKEFFGTIYSAPGTSTVNLDIGDFKTEDYAISMVPTTRFNGAYQPAVAFPTTFGWAVVAKSNSQVSFYFSGIPNLGTTPDPIGLTWEVFVRANPTS